MFKKISFLPEIFLKWEVFTVRTNFYGKDKFSGKSRFLIISALIWRKRYFLEYVYNVKSNVIQVLESDYIDSNCLY